MIRYDIVYDIYDIIRYDVTFLLSAIGLTPGGSSTVHIYTQTQWQQYSTHLHTNPMAAVQYTFTHKPNGSSTVHIYTQTVHRTTQWKQNIQNGTYLTLRIHKQKNKNA